MSGVDEAESGIPRSICDYRCSIGQIPPGRYQLLVGQVKHVLHKYRLSISGTHADKTMIATEGASMTFYASKCWTLAAESDEGPTWANAEACHRNSNEDVFSFVFKQATTDTCDDVYANAMRVSTHNYLNADPAEKVSNESG